MAPDELGVLLEAHSRHATAELPPGEPGVRWAADFLAALPVACARRLPDLITTGPKMFEFLVGQGFFAAMPSPRLVPLVLGLVARVSPLLQARSARQWALWLARVWDSGSPVLAAIRKRTPAHLIGIQTPAPAGPLLRAAQIRDERDRLAADLVNATTVNDQLRAVLTQVSDEGNRLAAELDAATEQEQQAVAAVAAERDRLAGELAAAAEQLRQAAKTAATDGARLQQSQALNESLTGELAGARTERERMSSALAVAEETARQRIAEHELMARVLAAEKLTSEQLRGELAVLRRDLEAPIESTPPVMKPVDVLHAAFTGFRTARMRRAAVAMGLHPDHDLLATDRIVGATRAVVMLEPPPFERLTDREWKQIGPIVEATRGTCGGTRTDLRLAVDAIRWVLHNGAKWREMPKDLGSPTTCWRWYERWCGDGTWAQVTAALELPAIEVGREPRHMPRSGARPKPTIEVAAIEVGPSTGRRSGRPSTPRRSA